MQEYSDSLETRLTARHGACIRFSGDLRGKLVLDVGCWIGWCERLVDSGLIMGLDVDVKSLKLARGNNPGYDYVRASALYLPFSDGAFQAVLMFDMLEHTPRGAEPLVFQEARRALSTNGKVVVSTYSMNPVTILSDPAFFLAGHRHYTLEALERIISENGFKTCETGSGGGIVEACGMILLYVFKHGFHREIPFKPWFDRQREKEFQGKGFMELFVRAVKK